MAAALATIEEVLANPSVLAGLSAGDGVHSLEARLDGARRRLDEGAAKAKVGFCVSNRVERFFSKLKQYRRIATRYDKLLINFLAAVKPAANHILLR